MQIRIKQKGDSRIPPKNQVQRQNIFNIIPITQAKNKDFLKIITKSYPESLRKWVLKNYPRNQKGDSESLAQIINIHEWRLKMKKVAKNVVTGIALIIGSIFLNMIFLTWLVTDESESYTTLNDVIYMFSN